MKKVITTVGTSLFTNYNKKNKEELNKDIKNKAYDEYNEWVTDNKIKKDLLNFIDEEGDRACAELTSIMKLKEKYGDIEVYLLATDTIESVLVCEVLKEVLGGKEINVFFKEQDILKNLNINKKKHFIKGIDKLIERIFNLITNYRGQVLKANEVIFNITGGYKGVIPYFSTIAQIFDYEIVYTFEDESSDLIVINPLPVEIDRGILELYYPFLDNLDILDDKVERELESLGLIAYKNLTPLGKIALLTVKNTPLSKDVFGHFIEYKVYEYFVQRLFDKRFQCECLNFEYSKVGHGVSLGKDLSDIDILLEQGDDIVWIEVKPISYLIDTTNKNKLLSQIKDKQLGKLKESVFRDKNLKKYILIVYLYNKDLLRQIKNETIEEFKNLFKNIDFSVCYFDIKLSKSDIRDKTLSNSTYQTAMKDFQIKQLKEIENV